MGIAAQLLEEIDLRLGEIALRLGYRSEFSFSRAFKASSGRLANSVPPRYAGSAVPCTSAWMESP